jgi:hypothetical protein
MRVLAAASRSFAVALAFFAAAVVLAEAVVVLAAALTTTGFGFAAVGPFFLPGGAMNPEAGMGDNRSEYDVDLVLGGITHSGYFFILDRTQWKYKV